jgi:hypothetical protein
MFRHIALTAVLTCFGALTFAQEGSIGPNARITLKAGGSSFSASDLSINSKDASDVIIAVGEGKTMDARFHNPTEAKWFLQMAKQMSGEFTMSLSGKYKPGTSVDKYIVGLSNDITSTITWTADDQVIAECQPAGTTSTENRISAASVTAKMNMDEFIDLFRWNMEKQGIWFGAEGKKDRKSNFKCP